MIDRGYIWRMIATVLVIVAVWVGLGTRLVFLHLGPNDGLRARVEDIRTYRERILVGRGRILDRNGNLLALDLAVKNVCADPKAILAKGQLQAVGYFLARKLQLDPAMVFTRLNRPQRRFEYIKKYVEQDLVDELVRMQLTGVFFEEASARHYPHGMLMSHVVGFSNVEGVGSAGIEQRMNRYLRGRSGLRVSEKDGHRRELYTRRILDIAPQKGSDIHLTLDLQVQYMIEKALDEAMETHSAKGAWAIVQRVRTGEILGMACRPSYDLNEYRGTPPETMLNRSIGYVYEPGSTFKVAVVAAALNEGTIRPDTIVDCENGMWFYGGRPLRDFHPYGKLSVRDVIKKSSNIGAAKAAITLGPERLERYLREFGIGRASGIELPGEEGGILHPVRKWSALSITRIAMGHEVAVTSLQMLNAMCAIANDGFLMRPHAIRRVTDSAGRTLFENQPEVIARPIRQDTARTMREMLARVTEEGGTGRRAKLDGYTVAGKTGTAQKPVAGGYSDSANMASFVGFVPAEAPEIGIIVVVDEPQPLHTGGAVAAPIFREIASQLVRYLDIPPTDSEGVIATREDDVEELEGYIL